MKKIQTLINISILTIISMVITLFIFPPSYGIADGINHTEYLYLFGFPFDWLTISRSVDSTDNFINLFMDGNLGIRLQWIYLVINFVIILIIFYIVLYVSKRNFKTWIVKLS